jgi:hypothetical protein
VFILVLMAVAAPLAAYIPRAALAGVLAVVAWNMIKNPAIAVLVRSGWGEATVLATTFALTIFPDLAEAIVVGFAFGSVLFVHRMSEITAVVTHSPFIRRGLALWLTGPSCDIRRVLVTHGLKRPLVPYATTMEAVLRRLRERQKTSDDQPLPTDVQPSMA